MPWISQEFDKLVQESKSLVKKEFPDITFDWPVFIASKDEMDIAIIKELKDLNYSKRQIEDVVNYFLPYLIGKYFAQTNEIWVLQMKGENLDTIVHELLHSIQKCKPHRESIVNYLTFKITGEKNYINDNLRKDWEEIEKNTSYQRIKNKLLSEGDCEEIE